VSESARRFDAHAANYATSDLHKDSPSIRRLHEILCIRKGASVCDVACGAGHLGLSFAEVAARIVGVDPAPKMLATFEALAKERGIAVERVESSAESMPLASASFDLVATRLAAHHFDDVQAAVNEMARLAKPGGFVAVIDLVGHDDPAIDALNHRIELLHDPTHVRSYRAVDWRAFLERAGLVIEALELHHERPQGISIARWCETTKPGLENERAIRAELAGAPLSTLQALDIRAEDGEFHVTSRSILALARTA
jgi:SAM-dependent methyltransferase